MESELNVAMRDIAEGKAGLVDQVGDVKSVEDALLLGTTLGS